MSRDDHTLVGRAIFDANKSLYQAIEKLPVIGPSVVSASDSACNLGFKYVNPAGCDAIKEMVHDRDPLNAFQSHDLGHIPAPETPNNRTAGPSTALKR